MTPSISCVRSRARARGIATIYLSGLLIPILLSQQSPLRFDSSHHTQRRLLNSWCSYRSSPTAPPLDGRRRVLVSFFCCNVKDKWQRETGHLLSNYIDLQCKVRIPLKISTHREMNIEAFLKKKIRVDFPEIFNTRNSVIGNKEETVLSRFFSSTREKMRLHWPPEEKYNCCT